jgi:hypothetical protein
MPLIQTFLVISYALIPNVNIHTIDILIPMRIGQRWDANIAHAIGLKFSMHGVHENQSSAPQHEVEIK